MNRRTRWDPAALAYFYALPMHSAAMVDRAVQRFVLTGEGVVWDPPYYVLGAGKHDLLITVDADGSAVNVLRIYRARR